MQDRVPCPYLFNLSPIENESPDDTIKRIQDNVASTGKVNIEDYSGLPRAAHAIVDHWYHEATRTPGTDDPQEAFVQFINAWISFNCWMTTVTDQPRTEADMLKIIEAWPRLQKAFNAYDQKNSFDVARFAEAWPIVDMREARLLYKYIKGTPVQKDAKKAADFRRKLSGDGCKRYEKLYESMIHDANVDMKSIQQDLFRLLSDKKVLNDYSGLWSPACFVYHKTWLSHPVEESDIPIDWPHVLSAIYQVRCNLFHGDKTAHARRDVEVVVPASHVLIGFLKTSNYPHY